jgi:hypothetical protein
MRWLHSTRHHEKVPQEGQRIQRLQGLRGSHTEGSRCRITPGKDNGVRARQVRQVTMTDRPLT